MKLDCAPLPWLTPQHSRLCLPHGADRALQHSSVNMGLASTSAEQHDSSCSWSCSHFISLLRKLPPCPQQPRHPLDLPLSLLCTCLMSHLGTTSPAYRLPTGARAWLGAAQTSSCRQPEQQSMLGPGTSSWQRVGRTPCQAFEGLERHRHTWQLPTVHKPSPSSQRERCSRNRDEN